MMSGLITCMSTEESLNVSYEVFASRMKYALDVFSSTVIDEVDMVFFTILDTMNHYFIVCYNFKTPAWEIDNRVYEGDIEIKYASHLHKNFVKFLKKLNNPRATSIQNLTLSWICMSWRTNKVNQECGIFAMRHLESYMGQSNWDCQLIVEGAKHGRQIKRLRSLYLNTCEKKKITLFETNCDL